jgi:hypothetical protein
MALRNKQGVIACFVGRNLPEKMQRLDARLPSFRYRQTLRFDPTVVFPVALLRPKNTVRNTVKKFRWPQPASGTKSDITKNQ